MYKCGCLKVFMWALACVNFFQWGDFPLVYFNACSDWVQKNKSWWPPPTPRFVALDCWYWSACFRCTRASSHSLYHPLPLWALRKTLTNSTVALVPAHIKELMCCCSTGDVQVEHSAAVCRCARANISMVAALLLVGPEWWKSRTMCLELESASAHTWALHNKFGKFSNHHQNILSSNKWLWNASLACYVGNRTSEWAPSTRLSQILSQILERRQLIVSRLICWTFQQDALVLSY